LISSLQKSIELIIAQSPDYEFRSTLIKGWHQPEDIGQMAKMIANAKKYFLQKFQPNTPLLNPEFQKYQPFSLLEMTKLAKQALQYAQKCEVRGY